MSRVEQSMESFPNLGDFDRNTHKIVKKQMTASDYKHPKKKKNKRSVFSLRCEGGGRCEHRKKMGKNNWGCRRKRLEASENGEKLENEYFIASKGNRICSRNTVGKPKNKKLKKNKVFDKDNGQLEETSTEIEITVIPDAMKDISLPDSDTTESPPEDDKSDEESTDSSDSSDNPPENPPEKTKGNGKGKESEKEMEKKIQKELEKVLDKAIEKSNEKIEEKTNGCKGNEKEKAKGKANEKKIEKEMEKEIEKEIEKIMEKESEKEMGKAVDKGNDKCKKIDEKTEKQEKLKKGNPANKSVLNEQFQVLKSLVGSKMNKFCRFPDIQDKHCYFESDIDNCGCIKLIHKSCPGDEIFSFKYLECLKPMFWKLVEREKRSLFKSGKKHRYYGTWADEVPNSWSDVNREETKQIPVEFRPKCKPKLVLYHLKVKKNVNNKCRKRRFDHALAAPGRIHRMGRFRKGHTLVRDHLVIPRSFVVRMNRKEGKGNNEESKLEDDKEGYEDNGEDDDEEEDDDEDDYDDDSEFGDEAEEEDDDMEDYDEEVNEVTKTTERSGIKEFLKSAKEAITNKARFNEPADTSFTIDKANSYSKSAKLDEPEKELKKILIDADIKVDKTFGKALKRILGKRKDRDRDFFQSDTDGENQDEEMTMLESMMKNNPRFKRYFLVPCGDRRLKRRP